MGNNLQFRGISRIRYGKAELRTRADFPKGFAQRILPIEFFDGHGRREYQKGNGGLPASGRACGQALQCHFEAVQKPRQSRIAEKS